MKTTEIEISLQEKALMLNAHDVFNGFLDINDSQLEKNTSYLNLTFDNFYPKSTIETVFENLDNAMDNDYTEMLTDDVNIIVEDMQLNSSTIEELNISNNNLEQIVKLWRTKQI